MKANTSTTRRVAAAAAALLISLSGSVASAQQRDPYPQGTTLRGVHDDSGAGFGVAPRTPRDRAVEFPYHGAEQGLGIYDTVPGRRARSPQEVYDPYYTYPEAQSDWPPSARPYYTERGYPHGRQWTAEQYDPYAQPGYTPGSGRPMMYGRDRYQDPRYQDPTWGGQNSQNPGGWFTQDDARGQQRYDGQWGPHGQIQDRWQYQQQRGWEQQDQRGQWDQQDQWGQQDQWEQQQRGQQDRTPELWRQQAPWNEQWRRQQQYDRQQMWGAQRPAYQSDAMWQREAQRDRQRGAWRQPDPRGADQWGYQEPFPQQQQRQRWQQDGNGWNSPQGQRNSPSSMNSNTQPRRSNQPGAADNGMRGEYGNEAGFGYYYQWNPSTETWDLHYGYHSARYQTGPGVGAQRPRQPGSSANGGWDGGWEDQLGGQLGFNPLVGAAAEQPAVRGRIESLQPAQFLPGHGRAAVVTVRLADGSTELVSLGRLEDLDRLGLRRGDVITVSGRQGMVGAQPVFMANLVEFQGQRFGVTQPVELIRQDAPGYRYFDQPGNSSPQWGEARYHQRRFDDARFRGYSVQRAGEPWYQDVHFEQQQLRQQPLYDPWYERAEVRQQPLYDPLLARQEEQLRWQRPIDPWQQPQAISARQQTVQQRDRAWGQPDEFRWEQHQDEAEFPGAFRRHEQQMQRTPAMQPRSGAQLQRSGLGQRTEPVRFSPPQPQGFGQQTGPAGEIGGRVQELAYTNLPGISTDDVLVQLRLTGDRERLVNLGSNLTPHQFEQIDSADTLRIRGRLARVNGEEVIIADQVSVDGSIFGVRHGGGWGY